MTKVNIYPGAVELPFVLPEQLPALLICIQQSEQVWQGLAANEVCCIWGLIPPSLLSEQAYLWLHTTPAAKDHAFIFVRHAQRQMEAMLQTYPTIVGHCDVRQEQSMRFVKFLGAQFGEPDGFKVPFTIRKKQDG